MSISYKSQTFHSSPYVLPVDLGLFENVMSVKQKKFDDNAAKLQTEIDKMGLLDVIKDQDRNYLNQKINQITSTINNLGGVDLSDQTIYGQLESLGKNVYSDENIVNAVSSTKSIRKLQQNYEKYKTDPKLSKMYAPQNEAFDMRSVNKYMAEDNVGSKYSGPTTPTVYTPFRDNLMKALEKIQPDYTQQLTDQGLFYVDSQGKRITPERIMSIASELLTAQERQQISIDGWYSYKDLPQETVINKGLEQFSLKRQDAEATLKQYEIASAAAVSDPEAKIRYDYLIKEQKKVVDDIKRGEMSARDQLIKKYNEAPEQLYAELYNTDFMRGLGNRFSYNQVTTKIIPNTAKMFELRMQQADNQFAQTMAFKSSELLAKLSSDEEKNTIELLKIGKARHVDPQTGEISYIDIPGWSDGKKTGGTEPSLYIHDVATHDTDAVTEKTIISQNDQLKLNNDELSRRFIDKLLIANPELEEVVHGNVGKGFTRKIRGQEIIEQFNGQPGFQMEDLKAFEKDASGNFVNADKISYFNRMYKLKPSELELLANQWKNYKALTDNKGSVPVNLLDGFEDLAEQITINKQVISANDAKLEAVKEQVYKELGLTPEVVKSLGYTEPFVPVGTNIPGGNPLNATGLGGLDKWFQTLHNDDFAKPLRQEIQKRINDKLKVLTNWEQYGLRTLSEGEPAFKQLSNLVSIDLSQNKGEPYGDGEKLDLSSISSANIKPIAIGKASDGTGRQMIISEVTLGSGEKKATVKYKTYIEPDVASQFKLEEDAYQGLNYAVAVRGRTDEIPVYSNKNLSVNVMIIGNGTTNKNDQSSFAKIVVYDTDDKGERTGKYTTIDMPGTEGRNASESFRKAKLAIKQAGAAGLKSQDFIDYLIKYKTRVSGQ